MFRRAASRPPTRKDTPDYQLSRLRELHASLGEAVPSNWYFLSDFRQRGTLALDALRAQSAQSPWGVASNGRILDESRLRYIEEMFLLDRASFFPLLSSR
jgi:hypothetical protein